MALKNTKQELFAQAVAKGMSQDAAYIAAGYKANGKDETRRGSASTLRSKPIVAARISELQEIATREAIKEVKRVILTKQEMQEWWSKLVLSQGGSFFEMKDRLKASELLGKSEAWFTEKMEHSMNRTLADILTESWEK